MFIPGTNSNSYKLGNATVNPVVFNLFNGFVTRTVVCSLEYVTFEYLFHLTRKLSVEKLDKDMKLFSVKT
jgi:hypothetical protein